MERRNRKDGRVQTNFPGQHTHEIFFKVSSQTPLIRFFHPSIKLGKCLTSSGAAW